MAYDFYTIIEWGFNNKFLAKDNKELSKNVVIVFAFLMSCMIMVLITAFLRFHLRLATENKTTIENLDKK